MKPPECVICGNFLQYNEGGLIHFKLTPDDRRWHLKNRLKEVNGNPPEAMWFCEKHYEVAKRFDHFKKHEGMRHIKRTIALEEYL